MKKVYLAGPITGQSFKGSEEWRDVFKVLAGQSKLAGRVELYSPLRGKDYLLNEVKIQDAYEQHLFSTQRAIMTRDYYDVTTCDALVINFTNAERVSIGTVMEIGWAYAKRTPIIIIGGKGGIHDHSFIREAAGWWVDSTIDAVRVLETIFNP